MKAGLIRSGIREMALGGDRAKAKGARRLERSESGCPMVDISQLERGVQYVREGRFRNDSITLKSQ